MESDTESECGYSSSSSEEDSGSSSDENAQTTFDSAFFRPKANGKGYTSTPQFGSGIRKANDFDAMEARIRSLCDVDDEDGRFWIGKFSGGPHGGYSGIRRRWNSKYKTRGMASAAIIYSTSSQKNAFRAEKILIDRFWSQCANPTKGSDWGPEGKSGPYGVYLMWDD